MGHCCQIGVHAEHGHHDLPLTFLPRSHQQVMGEDAFGWPQFRQQASTCQALRGTNVRVLFVLVYSTIYTAHCQHTEVSPIALAHAMKDPAADNRTFNHTMHIHQNVHRTPHGSLQCHACAKHPASPHNALKWRAVQMSNTPLHARARSSGGEAT